MTKRPIRICLIGHSTRSDNLGVGALTVSEVEILRGIARDLDRPLGPATRCPSAVLAGG